MGGAAKRRRPEKIRSPRRLDSVHLAGTRCDEVVSDDFRLTALCIPPKCA